MRGLVQIVSLMLALAGVCAAQEVVDRIVATVNHQPVLLSDWEVEIRFEALLEQKALPVSDEVARAALDRLIDQELLRQQIRSYRLAAPSPEEIDGRVAEMRKQLPDGENNGAYAAQLARYGLSAKEVRERVENQLEILRFIDLRMRPSVHIDRRSIEAYYNDTLLPELRRKGAKASPLAEVSPQIEELLSQQRVDALTSDWLKDLRQQSEIHIDPAAEPAPAARAKTPDQARK